MGPEGKFAPYFLSLLFSLLNQTIENTIFHPPCFHPNQPYPKSFPGGLQGDSNRTDFVANCVSKVSIQEYRIVSRMNLYTLSSLFRRLRVSLWWLHLYLYNWECLPSNAFIIKISLLVVQIQIWSSRNTEWNNVIREMTDYQTFSYSTCQGWYEDKVPKCALAWSHAVSEFQQLEASVIWKKRKKKSHLNAFAIF